MNDIQRPDTYFLQDTINRGIEAIIARLDYEKGCLPHFGLHVLPEPRLVHDIWDNGDMCARYTDAFILGRQVTGNMDYVNEELAINNMLYQCDPYQHPFMATRVLIALVDKYLQKPNKKNKRRLDGLIDVIRLNMKYEKDYAYYFKPREGWLSLKEPIFGDFLPYPTYPIGGIILALSRYLEAVYDDEIDDFTNKLVKFVTEHSGIFNENGHYYGHTHSGGILTAAVGITRYAFFKKDIKLINLMRGTFEWTLKHCSSWGWVPDGLGEPNGSCESCSITDALHFILLMAKNINPVYYEIAERYARNQLIENQFKNTDIKILNGNWASWSKPNCLDNGLNMVEGCCLGSGIRGCFLVWDSVIEKKNDTVYVNMMFSRNSPWLEIISYQPYEGRIGIIIHDAEKIMVRIPSWVKKEEVQININNTSVCVDYENEIYVKLSGLKQNDNIKIQYPLRYAVIPEVVNRTEYLAEWKGDTVVSISPKGKLYPLFEREYMKANTAPILNEQPYKYQIGGPVFW
jgi:hypothetical protein